MDRGTYSAATAGILQLTKLEIVNNNLANLSTPGFKSQYLVSKKAEFEDTLASAVAKGDPYAKGDHERSPGVKEVSTITDFSAGPIQHTGNDLNAALRNENEFFVVNTNEGPQYTRAGNFTLDQQGRLVTSDGFPVAGDGGELIIQGGIGKITSGGFIEVNGNRVGQLQIVKIQDPASSLQRVGSNRFKLIDGTATPEAVPTPSLVPKSIEGANVSAVQAIVELISASRGFELYTKTAQSIDSMNQSAIQRLGGRGV